MRAVPHAVRSGRPCSRPPALPGEVVDYTSFRRKPSYEVAVAATGTEGAEPFEPFDEGSLDLIAVLEKPT